MRENKLFSYKTVISLKEDFSAKNSFAILKYLYII